MSNKKFLLLVLNLTLLVTAALCIFVTPLDRYYFHPDELMHLDIADGATLSEVLSRGSRELHPPGSHILRHLILQGSEDVKVHRLFSIIPGVASVICAYLLGYIWLNPVAGVVLASIQLLAPFSVTYSFSIRNYALFQTSLYLLTLSLLFLGERATQKRSLLFGSLALFSCSLHYSGFFFAGSCALSYLAFSRIGKIKLPNFSNRQWFQIVGISLLLGISLSIPLLSSNTMISGWVTYLYGKTTTPAFKTAGSVEDFTFQLLEVYTGFFGGSTKRAIALLAATITGLLLALKRNSLWGIFPITVFCGELLLNFFHLFPLTGSRYCTWIFLPIGMCISYLAYHVSERFSKSGQQILSLSMSAVALVYAHHLASHDLYFKWNYETPLTVESWRYFTETFKTKIPEQSTVVTNKLGALYLNHHLFPDKTRYIEETIISKGYENRNVWLQSVKFKWDYEDWRDFYSVVNKIEETSSPVHLWFFSVALTDFSIGSLYNCAKSHNLITADLSPETKEFIVFSVSMKDIKSVLIEGSSLNQECFNRSKLRHLAQLMKAWQ
jgi:hypothetical protein